VSKVINKICFVVCILCIVAGSTVSILAIWGVVDAEATLWKALSTFTVIFFASLLTVLVNKMLLGARRLES
jgi:hypothetical protein